MSTRPVDLTQVGVAVDHGQELRHRDSLAPVIVDDRGEEGRFTTHAYFADHAKHLRGHIEKADIVVGCVAWLTDVDVLAALAARRSVSIVVQKEDFLRPDSKQAPRGRWAKDLRRRYEALPGLCRTERWDNRTPAGFLEGLNFNGAAMSEGVRCCGIVNRSRAIATPRSHHKFMVFCKFRRDFDTPFVDAKMVDSVSPYGVWTGSYNPTANARRSLENAVYLEQPEIVSAFVDEWARVLAISEPLDWSHDWVEPEYRIGT